MKNWSTDIKELKKNKRAYAIWRIEQMVNFGIDGEKIDRELLIKYWKYLKIDKVKRKYLRSILWKKQS